MEILQVKREEKTKDDELEEQYKNLKQFWDSSKQSKPRTKQRCSTDSYSIDESETNLYMLSISPRDLMSSLQQTEGGIWRIRNNDLAVEEIRMDRRAAIESGKLQGRRRLFEENHEEICSSWSDQVIRSVSTCDSDDGDQNHNGRTNDHEVNVVECCPNCYYCSSSSLSSENLEGENVMMEEEKMDVDGASGYRGTLMVFMVWLVIALVVFSLGIAFVKSLDGYLDQNEVILVPT